MKRMREESRGPDPFLTTPAAWYLGDTISVPNLTPQQRLLRVLQVFASHQMHALFVQAGASGLCKIGVYFGGFEQQHPLLSSLQARVQAFFFFLTSLLEYNCFTMVCFCCIRNRISCTYTYIPISPPSCVSLPPSLSHPSRWSQSTELISLCYVAASH